jgi:hypothetical protein
MNNKQHYLLLGLFFLLSQHLWGLDAILAQAPLLDQQRHFLSITPWSKVQILPSETVIKNNVVTLQWSINIDDLSVKKTFSHVFVPLLTSLNDTLRLPCLIVSGRKRASYDTRERALNTFKRDPHTISIYHKGKPIAPIHYTVSFPYEPWMRDCALELQQVSETTWRSELLSTNLMCSHFSAVTGLALQGGVVPAPPLLAQAVAPIAQPVVAAVPTPVVQPDSQPVAVAVVQAPPVVQPAVVRAVSPPVEEAVIAPAVAPVSDFKTSPAPAVKRVTVRTIRKVVNLSYPKGASGVDATYLNNASELNSVDELIFNLLNTSGSTLRKLLITGYSSPEGHYQDNERFSRKRAEAFSRYLRSAYTLPPNTVVRTAWVAEDWAGLKGYLKKSTIPYRHEALAIIEGVGIFEGRERKLMDLHNGDLYRNIKQRYFPKLRRIELLIEQELVD